MDKQIEEMQRRADATSRESESTIADARRHIERAGESLEQVQSTRLSKEEAAQ
jgi:hypothetical protein